MRPPVLVLALLFPSPRVVPRAVIATHSSTTLLSSPHPPPRSFRASWLLNASTKVLDVLDAVNRLCATRHYDHHLERRECRRLFWHARWRFPRLTIVRWPSSSCATSTTLVLKSLVAPCSSSDPASSTQSKVYKAHEPTGRRFEDLLETNPTYRPSPPPTRALPRLKTGLQRRTNLCSRRDARLVLRTAPNVDIVNPRSDPLATAYLDSQRVLVQQWTRTE
ncbi:hypothetical protein EXIGLDRAFT_775009 [Exidia glandulosa HHB12029]|uniref:Uncharacterized protein n=1 Tax=Exidia glandulosa HHB12029 TaxID=1314781 RepID=A0A165E4H7_EXIGL|nr:hypothetical protein EXIGLDRAFT_775009 [Exidia glandulosa HHB12029]